MALWQTKSLRTKDKHLQQVQEVTAGSFRSSVVRESAWYAEVTGSKVQSPAGLM